MRSHLYSKHMEEKALSCSYCPFKLGYSLVQMHRHVEQNHPGVQVKYAYRNRRNEPAFLQYADKLGMEYFGEKPSPANSAEDALNSNGNPDEQVDFAFVLDKIDNGGSNTVVPAEQENWLNTFWNEFQ